MGQPEVSLSLGLDYRLAMADVALREQMDFSGKAFLVVAVVVLGVGALLAFEPDSDSAALPLALSGALAGVLAIPGVGLVRQRGWAPTAGLLVSLLICLLFSLFLALPISIALASRMINAGSDAHIKPEFMLGAALACVAVYRVPFRMWSLRQAWLQRVQ